ncbi:hypothetical protein FC764_14030 [Clostridium botulinum]|nr:hypothetical protein [Clostridium botulinum]
MELYDIENLAEYYPNKFINYILEIYNKHGIDRAIKLLKKSGACINKNLKNEEKFFYTYNKIINKFCECEENQIKINQFKNEVNIINNAYKILNRRIETESNFPKDKQMVAYLLALEQFLLKCSNNDMKKELGFGDDYNYNNVNVNLFDNVSELGGEVLKYFMYKSISIENFHVPISNNEIEIASKHITFLEEEAFLNQLVQLWSYYNLEVSQQKGIIKFKVIGNKALGAIISKQRFFDIRYAKLSRFAYMKAKELKNNTYNIMNSSEEYKKITKEFINEYFSEYGFDVEFGGMKLKYLINAYTAIFHESEIFMKNIKDVKNVKLRLSHLCIIKEYKKWKRIFMSYGIPKEVVDKIIEFLIFDKKSRDLYDCPFIKVNKFLILVPSISMNIDPSRAIMSNLANKKYDVGIKGNNFEKDISEVLDNANIQNMCYEVYNENHKKYQCDRIFVIDNDLYFAELKHLNNPVNYREYERNLDEITDACNQLERIEKYLITNRLEDIKQKLQINNINNIYKLVITNTERGEKSVINETFVIDKTLFDGYFKRNAPAIHQIDRDVIKTAELYKQYYIGKITSKQFLELIKVNPYIEMSQKRVGYREYNYSKLFGIILEEYASKVDGVVFNKNKF